MCIYCILRVCRVAVLQKRKNFAKQNMCASTFSSVVLILFSPQCSLNWKRVPFQVYFGDFAQSNSKSRINVFWRRKCPFLQKKKWMVFSRIFCTIFAGYYYSPLCVHSSRSSRRVLVSFISSSIVVTPLSNQMSWSGVRRLHIMYSWEDIVGVFTDIFFVFFVAAFYSISRFSPHMAPEGFTWRKFQNDHDRNY